MARQRGEDEGAVHGERHRACRAHRLQLAAEGDGVHAQRAQADFFLESISVVQDDWAIYLIVLLSLLCLFRCLAVIALARRASAFF